MFYPRDRCPIDAALRGVRCLATALQLPSLPSKMGFDLHTRLYISGLNLDQCSAFGPLRFLSATCGGWMEACTGGTGCRDAATCPVVVFRGRLR